MAEERAEERWDARYREGDTPWDSGLPSVELQRLLGSYGIGPGLALELGCGTGTNAVWLAQRGFTVTALDLSPTALERARDKARQAGVEVRFLQADLKAGWPEGEPIVQADLVFDRGTYHILRREDLDAWRRIVADATRPGSQLVVLTGNANDPSELPGPPRVHAHELCAELQPLFDLVELREFRWSTVRIGDQETRPLGWSALFRRR